MRRGTDWARYALVLDVRRDAVGLSFGVLRDGSGQVWLDDVALQSVGRDVPLTGRRDRLFPTGVTPQAARADARRRVTQAVAYQGALLRPATWASPRGRGCRSRLHSPARRADTCGHGGATAVNGMRGGSAACGAGLPLGTFAARCGLQDV